MLRSEGDRLTRVVVCTPEKEYFDVADVKSHNINETADRPRTIEQHGLLKRAMSDMGCEVIDAEELPGHPNSVFTRDVALVTPRGYIELRMGLDTRWGEEKWMGRILEECGEPRAGKIVAPGTVEGGDVTLAGSVAFVGRSARTNEEGVRQLRGLLESMDYEVRVAPIEGHLHLGGALSAVAPDRVVCCRGEFSADFLKGFDVIEVEKRGPSTGNVICLGPNQVLADEAENAEAMEVLVRNSIEVHGINLSEFRKGAGGPTCLILPVTRE